MLNGGGFLYAWGWGSGELFWGKMKKNLVYWRGFCIFNKPKTN